MASRCVLVSKRYNFIRSMFTHHRSLGIILNKKDIGEADQLFTVLTKNFGKVFIAAKGIRKISSKLRSGIDLLYLSEIAFIEGRGRKTLTDALVLDKFEKLHAESARLKIAYKMADMINAVLKEEERDPEAFQAFRNMLATLDSDSLDDNKLLPFYLYCLWNFAGHIGYKPDLSACILCDKKLIPGKLAFCFGSGGIVCTHCFPRGAKNDKIPIRPDEVKILRLIFARPWEEIIKIKIENSAAINLNKILEGYFRQIKPIANYI